MTALTTDLLSVTIDVTRLAFTLTAILICQQTGKEIKQFVHIVKLHVKCPCKRFVRHKRQSDKMNQPFFERVNFPTRCGR